jgi:hypothetical protein
MQITANEIAAVEEAGSLDGSPVKMIRTKGGFWICVGKLRGKLNEEALAAGSHPAIVKYNLSKQYPMFQEAMMKSEAMAGSEGVVEKHSHFLTEDLRKSGHDIYSVQNGPDITFHVTKQNVKVAQGTAHVQDGALVITAMTGPKEFARGLAGAATEKALSAGANRLKIEAK